MNKKLIKYTFVLLLLTLEACSYKPIYSNNKISFEISDIIFTGEKDINKIIERKLSLNREEGKKNIKVYNLEIDTIKKRIIVSKDSKGDPIKFELIITAKYSVYDEGKLILTNKIEKNNIYNNDSDKFKLSQNEQITLENMSEIISDNIISSIINMNDN